MDTLTLDTDIKVFCIKASSFPQGIGEAHQKLHALVPFNTRRKYFGLSAPEGGKGIVYRSAAEELEPGELSKHNLEQFIIRKGEYVFTDVKDFMKNPQAIGETFRKLLSSPGIDPQGCCVEWYLDDTHCRCMVRLKG